MFRLFRIGFAFALLVAVTSAIALRLITPPRPQAKPELLMPLVASADGIVGKWSAALGTQVGPGDTLVRLDNEAIGRELKEASKPTQSFDAVAIMPFSLPSMPRLDGRFVYSPVSSSSSTKMSSAAPARDNAGEMDAIESSIKVAEAEKESLLELEAKAKLELAEVEALLPSLEADLRSAEAKRDKNVNLYELGAVSRNAAEKTEQAASEALANFSNAKGRVQALTTVLEEASAKAWAAQLEIGVLRDKRKELIAKLETAPPAVVSEPPSRPQRLPSLPRAAAPPPVPVVVIVDQPALEEAEDEGEIAQSRLDAARNAHEELTIRSVEKGILAAIEKPAGTRVRKGDILGWLRPSR